MRRIAPLLLLGLLLACGRGPERPNVIVLVLDTVRADHLSAYGYPRETSPNIDRLAAESVLFEEALSAAPWTLPSHASLFTGVLPSRHGAHHEHLRLDGPYPTIAERLAAEGYETVGFSNNPWVTEQTGLARGYERFVEVWRDLVSRGSFNLNILVDPERHGMEDAGASLVEERIADWLDGREDRPFLLFVNLIEAHSPFDPPGSFRDRFGSEASREAVHALNLDFPRAVYNGELEPEMQQRIVDLYDGEIAYLDGWVERFVRELRLRGLFDDSLFVLTSDHGEAFGEHQLCGVPLIDHQLSLHRELLRVPLLVRFPGGRDGGRRVEETVSLLDVVPTILEELGLEAEGQLPGQPLGSPSTPGRAHVAQYYRPLVHTSFLESYVTDGRRLACLVNRRLVAGQRGKEKMILSTRGELAWFRLDRDPGEQVTLEPPRPDTHPLAELLVEHLQGLGASAAFEEPEIDEATREALRSLGYL